MSVRVIQIKEKAEARRLMEEIGADPAGIELMVPKATTRIIKLSGIKPVPANIIKQEMLSFGGEAATAYGSINHSVEITDLLVFGSLKQLRQLVEKLEIHQFGLPQVADQINQVLANYDSAPKPIKIGNKTLNFGQRTYIMGILNVTPDSFSDGGKFSDAADAIAFAKQMVSDGADIVDIGGESTRPGARPVSVEEEKQRVVPIIAKLVKETDAIISIDTTKAEVARAALSAGAHMVNDISGLRFDPKMAGVVAEFSAALSLMHIKGNPADMQKNPEYSDLMGEIINYLSEGLEIAKKAGILFEKIIVDPGIGFGKTIEHNLEILKSLYEIKGLGRPILIGTSRKSFIGQTLDLPIDQRLEGTAATIAIAIYNGADIIRVHDVAEMARVAKMSDSILGRKKNG